MGNARDARLEATLNCQIVGVVKRRDGGTRYWCLNHHANATAKYGTPADKCVAADDAPISDAETLNLDLGNYAGGAALWGPVPAVYDTTRRPADRGIHVHARAVPNGPKDIDWTYRKLRIPVSVDLLSNGWAEVDEIDAINYMVSGVFGFETTSVACSHCGFEHLDRDWFSVHAHKRHQCHGCGRQFSDSAQSIGNPLARVKKLIERAPRNNADAPRVISLKQRDYPGGLQIWGSNPAIIWTSSKAEEVGIHLHGFEDEVEQMPTLDDTYAKVEIDGIKLDAAQVRTYMAQSAMPHLEGRVVNLTCVHCGALHFDQCDMAFTPHLDHKCDSCGGWFKATTQMKKTIGNPFVETRLALSQKAVSPLRNDKLGLRVEAI